MGLVDGDAPEPIEVELTSHEPRSERGRWRRREPDVRADPDEDDEPTAEGPARGDRSQIVLVACVTAVLSLAVGWMLGRATGSDPETVAGTVADEVPETTRRTTTTEPPGTLPIVGEEIDEPDFDPDGPVPGETAPESVTAIEPNQPSTGPVAVDARLTGVPVRLVGVELGGTLVEADVAGGTLTDFGSDRIVTDGSPLVVGPDWVVASASSSRARVIWSDGDESTLPLGDYWRFLPVPGTDRFWRGSFGGVTGVGAFELVDLAGEPLGPVIETPANSWPVLVDPVTGGVAVTVAGRSYVVHGDGVEHLADGQIIALSEDVVVAYGCDEALVCSLSSIDRRTGEVTVLPPDPTLESPLRWDSSADWGGADSTISPDGRWSAVIGSSWRASVSGLVDLASGRFVELTEMISSPPSVSWSPDGRWAFYLDDRTPMVYDTVTDERFPVFTDVVQWIQLGARPPGDRIGGRAVDAPTLLSASPEEPIEG